MLERFRVRLFQLTLLLLLLSAQLRDDLRKAGDLGSLQHPLLVQFQRTLAQLAQVCLDL